MRIAPELYLKQLVVGGLDRVYELGRQFRNEGTDASHNPEFTTCEVYQAYANLPDLMNLTETMLTHIAREALGTTTLRVSHNDHVVEMDLSRPFQRLSFLDTVEARCGKLPLDSPHLCEHLLDVLRQHSISAPPPHTPASLLDRLGAAFVEPLCVQPTFVLDIPAALCPLAKRQSSNPYLSARFELFIAGREYCNAYEELNDPHEQRRRFQDQLKERDKGDEEAPLPDEAFCTALEYGLPPTGGWGLGVDRLIMLLAGKEHLRDVMAFPHARPKQE